MSSTNLLSPAQVAALLHVATKTLEGWRYKKPTRGPKWIKIGGKKGKVWYRQEDVEEYLKNGGDRPNSKMHEAGYVLPNRNDGLYWLQCVKCGEQWAENDDGIVKSGSRVCRGQ